MPRPSLKDMYSKRKLFSGPWYPRYPKDTFASQQIESLSLEEEAAFGRALDRAWIDGDIPADPDQCARIIGKGCSSATAKAILGLFVPSKSDPSRMINIELEEIRKTQKKKYDDKVRAGKISSQKRWKKSSSENNTVADALPLRDNNNNQNRDLELDEDGVNTNTKGAQKAMPHPSEGILQAIAEKKGVKTLPEKRKWSEAAKWALENNFTAERFLECFDLLSQQPWRETAIQPRHIMENLPDLDRLRKKSGIKVGSKGPGQPETVSTQAALQMIGARSTSFNV